MKANRKPGRVFNRIKRFWSSQVIDRVRDEEQGFTLIELLVSLTIGSALVSVLLLFLNQILETNQREDAKSITQQELQAALNYVADDLQEAIYIYDSDGLEAIQSQIPYGVGSSPAANNDIQPVLFFWKRYYYEPTERVSGSLVTSGAFTPATNTPVNCFTSNSTNCAYGTGVFSYSLVGYYLRKDGDSDWSNASRLARWELREGFKNPNCSGTLCAYVSADPGYQRFDLNAPGRSIADKMNAWRRSATTPPNDSTRATQGESGYPSPFPSAGINSLSAIIDFVDDTRHVAEVDDGTANNFPVEVPIRQNDAFTATPFVINGVTIQRFANDDCRDIAGTGQGSQRVIGDFRRRSNGGYNNTKELTGFYACVNSPAGGDNPSSVYPIARVYLRGNAIVRFADLPLENRTFYVTTPPATNTLQGQDLKIGTTLAPTSSILVTGRGFLNPTP